MTPLSPTGALDFFCFFSPRCCSISQPPMPTPSTRSTTITVMMSQVLSDASSGPEVGVGVAVGCLGPNFPPFASSSFFSLPPWPRAGWQAACPSRRMIPRQTRAGCSRRIQPMVMSASPVLLKVDVPNYLSGGLVGLEATSFEDFNDAGRLRVDALAGVAVLDRHADHLRVAA